MTLPPNRDDRYEDLLNSEHPEWLSSLNEKQLKVACAIVVCPYSMTDAAELSGVPFFELLQELEVEEVRQAARRLIMTHFEDLITLRSRLIRRVLNRLDADLDSPKDRTRLQAASLLMRHFHLERKLAERRAARELAYTNNSTGFEETLDLSKDVDDMTLDEMLNAVSHWTSDDDTLH